MANVPTPPEMITPEKMSSRCGMSAENIRNALRQGKFPVGFAFRADGGTWRYYIPRAEFENWLGGVIPSSLRTGEPEDARY